MGSKNLAPKSEGSGPNGGSSAQTGTRMGGHLAGLDHKLYYSISEVAEMAGLKPYVLRFWEKEFPFLNPKKNRAGNRSYQQKDIDLINQIKHLLYDEGYTIEGAKSKLKTFRYEDEEAKLVTEKMRLKNLLMEVRRELSELLGLLSDSKSSKGS